MLHLWQDLVFLEALLLLSEKAKGCVFLLNICSQNPSNWCFKVIYSNGLHIVRDKALCSDKTLYSSSAC